MRLLCDKDHQAEAEYQITRAVAVRALVLREIRAEEVEDTDNLLVQAILESTIRDTRLPNAIAEELKALPWVQSVEWTKAGAETE